MTRKPTTPEEILREEYLVPLEMSQKDLADHIEQDVKVINRIVNGRSAVTAEVALKLAATFRTTPEFWLNAQKAVDLWTARRTLRKLPKPLVRSVAYDLRPYQNEFGTALRARMDSARRTSTATSS